MRIAICFSGQPRTWEKCHPGLMSFISKLKNLLNADIDIFCHAWDYNSPSWQVVSQVQPEFEQEISGVTISEEEKNRIITMFNPVSYLFENKESNRNKELTTKLESNKYEAQYGGSSIAYLSGQFYSVMMSAHLKKKYEIHNNFVYDVCMRMRYDLFIDEYQGDWLTRKEWNKFVVPKDNTIYPVYASELKFGDIFWYGNSVTFDRMCDFYRWMPFMGKATFPSRRVIGSELSLYFYAKMLKMDIHSIGWDPKICRGEEHLELIKKNNIDLATGGCNVII
jgi:hypothetical protein